MVFKSIAIGVAVLAATPSQAQTPASPKPQIAAPKQAQPSPADLERRLLLLETQLRGLQARVQYKGASLDCDSKLYTEFQFTNSTLVFLAACTNIEPYLEGHKVTVQVNNPYSVLFSGITGTLGYGKTPFEVFERTVDISTTQSLASGSWTTIVVTVNPSKAEDLRFIELNLSTKTAGGR